jgi:hypothetical protein
MIPDTRRRYYIFDGIVDCTIAACIEFGDYGPVGRMSQLTRPWWDAPIEWTFLQGATREIVKLHPTDYSTPPS